MKKLLITLSLPVLVALLTFLSCKKKDNSTPPPATNSSTTSSSTTATCCLAPFVSTSTLTTNPDSVYLPKDFLTSSSNRWEKWYCVISDGINKDTITTTGFEAYTNNPTNATNCLIYEEFGNILGMINSTDHYFISPTLAFYLPKDSNQVLSFPKGKYGFEKDYGASFSNDMLARCKGSLHFQFAINNMSYRSLPQTSTSTYFNEVQEIKFLKYNAANKIYSVKGVANVLMENQVNQTTKVVTLKYRLLVQYNS